jgi:hypothetical protein
MSDPNFSESQLQQAVNTAFIRSVFEKHGIWLFGNVPSLIDEFNLGWDSAFYFPWLPHPPHQNHEGSNVFIQYKLSSELKSAGAKEWHHWNAAYFRFKIPHSTKDSTGILFDDYHQWDRLKDLANQNYPTFYATNSTLSKDDLLNASQAGTLLDNIPLLDVRDVVSRHKHVTFIPSSTSFLLHSEKETSPKTNFAANMMKLSEKRSTTLKKASDSLLRVLKKIGKSDKVWNTDLRKIQETVDNPTRLPNEAWVVQVLLASFVRKHIGAELLWLPRDV